MAKPMFIYNPKAQFLDNSGLPVNGGKLFVYLPGTTTKQNTYPTAADAIAGTNANTNPIVLNSAGRPAVDMYIGAAFKLVLAPSTDTDPPASAYWTEDNITTLGQLVSTSAKTTSYVVTASDRDKLLTMDASGGARTFTLLACATAGDGFNLKLKKIDSSTNTVTIQCNAAETIDGSNTITLYNQNDYVEIYSNGTAWYSTNVPTNMVTSDGVFQFKGTSTHATYVRWFEDTDNGSNYLEHRAPASIASNKTITWADSDISQHLVQQVSTVTGAVATGTTTLPFDDTIPQNTEGDQYMTLAITPKSTSNILVIDVTFIGSNSAVAAVNLSAALFQDSTANALAVSSNTLSSTGALTCISFRHVMTAGTTSATTFKVRAGCSAVGTTTFNGTASARIFGGVMASSIVIREITP